MPTSELHGYCVCPVQDVVANSIRRLRVSMKKVFMVIPVASQSQAREIFFCTERNRKD